MQQVYSTRFVATGVTSTNTVYYTVPVGKVGVLRTMTFGFSEPAGTSGFFSVLLKANLSRIWTLTVAAATTGTGEWRGNLVLPEGEQLRAGYTGTAGQYFTASGYLLTLP